MGASATPGRAIPALQEDVRHLMRAYEPERYLAALLAPVLQRPSLLALTAFSADLRRITRTVTEPMMGEIRLQWWRDTIAALADGAVVGHPVADALGVALRTHALPPLMLVAMTEAHAFDLYADPMPDTAGQDGYFNKTEAVPFGLALRILGVPSDRADTVAANAGRAFGLARAYASWPEQAARGRAVPIPAPRLAAASRSDGPAEMTAIAVQNLITQGCADIDAACAAVWPQIALLSRAGRAALLPVAVVPAYRRALLAAANDGLRHPIGVSPLARVTRIAGAHYFSRWR